VGRLDKDSEGLLVMTNDGNLALKLTHPSQKVEKEYLVTVNQAFDNEIMDKLVKGVHTPEGRAAAKSVKRISPRRLRIVLETGLKRQIRIMFEALHIKVTKLVRIRIGSLVGGGIEVGQWRTPGLQRRTPAKGEKNYKTTKRAPKKTGRKQAKRRSNGRR